MTLLLLLIAVGAGAQQFEWKKMNGPEEGDVTSATESNGYHFIGTYGGGVYRSSNGGDSWEHVGGRTIRNIRGLASVGGVLFAGTTGAGVFLSRDNGETWSATGNETPADHMQHLIAHDGRLYGSYGVFYGAGGIIRSDDTGRTWKKLPGLPQDVVHSVAFHESTLFAATHLGLHISNDLGETWSRSQWPGHDLDIYSVAATDSVVLIRTFNAGLQRSTDNGATWTVIPNSMQDLYHMTATGTTFLIASTRSWGAYISTDNARTFTKTSVGDVTTDLLGVSAVGSTLYIGAKGVGVFRSTDGGTVWTIQSSGLNNASVNAIIHAGGSLVVGTSAGVWRSFDAGSHWTLLSGSLGRSEVRALAYDGERIYAGGDRGLHWTTDNGASWRVGALRYGSDYYSHINAIALHGTSGVVIAENSSNDAGVFATSDRFASSTMRLGVSTRSHVAFVHDTTFYASDDSWLNRSDDGGLTWKPVAYGERRSNIHDALVIGDTIFTATYYGVYRQSDTGSFRILAMGSRGTFRVGGFVTALALHEGKLYAATEYGEVARRDRAEDTVWTDISSDPLLRSVSDLLSDGNRLIAATLSGGGLWEHITGASDVDAEKSWRKDQRLMVHPTPSSGSVLVQPGNVDDLGAVIRLEIIDMQGRTVRTLEGELVGGTLIDCSDLPAGIYRVVLVGTRRIVTAPLIRK